MRKQKLKIYVRRKLLFIAEYLAQNKKKSEMVSLLKRGSVKNDVNLRTSS